MHYITLPSDPTSTPLPLLKFEVSERQQVMVIGLNSNQTFKGDKLSGPEPGVEAQLIGRLEDQNQLVQIELINGLIKANWDFSIHPNPGLILLTDQRITKN